MIPYFVREEIRLNFFFSEIIQLDFKKISKEFVTRHVSLSRIDHVQIKRGLHMGHTYVNFPTQLGHLSPNLPISDTVVIKTPLTYEKWLCLGEFCPLIYLFCERSHMGHIWVVCITVFPTFPINHPDTTRPHFDRDNECNLRPIKIE